MCWPMLPLTIGVAILDEPTRLARLETDGTSPLTALGAAISRRIDQIVHEEKTALELSFLFVSLNLKPTR